MYTLIDYSLDNELALIGLGRAPVNALGQAVREGLLNAFQQAEADQQVRAVALVCEGTTFIADLGFEPKPGSYMPGVSALVRKDGKIYRANYDYFGPGDFYCAPWHLFDLFPKGANGWHPKMGYK